MEESLKQEQEQDQEVEQDVDSDVAEKEFAESPSIIKKKDGVNRKFKSLPSSGTDVKLTLWIRPATWIFWRRCTALWLF